MTWPEAAVVIVCLLVVGGMVISALWSR